MSRFNFDANQIQPAVPLEPVPTGWYISHVVSSEERPTKDGLGAYLFLELEILTGTYKGRKLFARHNTKNSNPQAVDIGAKEISALCHAIQVYVVNDTTQLHHRPFEVRAVKREADGAYGESNDVKGYRPCSGEGSTPLPPSVGIPAPPAAPAAPQPPPLPVSAPPAPPAYTPPPLPPPAPVQAPPPPPPPVVAPTLSPDGKWELVNNAWQPYNPAPAAPPAPPAAPAAGLPPWART